MSLKKRALRGAAWAVVGGNASQVLAFIMFIAISRVVGPAAFGAVAVAIAIVELCRPLASEAVIGNLVARGQFDEDSFNAGFALCVGAALLISVLLWLVSPLLAVLFQTPDLEAVLPQIGLLLVFYAASRPLEARLMLDLRFDSLAARSITASLGGGLVGIAAAYAGWGVQALVLQQWTAAAISLVLMWSVSPWRPKLRFPLESARRLIRASLSLAPAGILAQLSILTDALAVASFSGPHAAGIYNLGKRMRLALQLGLSNALDRVSLPTFARANAASGTVNYALETALKLSTIVAFPIFIGVAAIGPELIELFLGAEWAAAALPTAILMVGGAVAMTTHYFDNVLLVLERRRTIALLRLMMLAVLVTGLLIFGRFGPPAVAIVALAATAVHNIAGFTTLKALAGAKWRIYLTNVALPLGISLAMLGVLTVLRQVDPIANLAAWERLIIFVLLGATFYLGAAWTLVRPAVRAVIHAAQTALAA